MTSVGEAAIELLAGRGVNTVFGIPGVHTLEFYRGLAGSGIRHVTPRHEQGGGFMADGFGRVTGTPGVCLVITGPGVTNVLTPVAQAYHDSKPLLVLSSSVAADGHGRGTIHDLPDQQALASSVTAFSHAVRSPDELADAMARAWDVFESGRPRPVHIQIPVDVLRAPAPDMPAARDPRARPVAGEAELRRAADVLAAAGRPVVLIGGGGVDAGVQALAVAELLDAPVGLTINARGVVPTGHPLCLGSAVSFPPISDLLLGADAMLAVGTEFSELDWWGLAEPPTLPAALVRIDVDPLQLGSRPCTPLLGDAAATLEALARLLSGRRPIGRCLRWPATAACCSRCPSSPRPATRASRSRWWCGTTTVTARSEIRWHASASNRSAPMPAPTTWSRSRAALAATACVRTIRARSRRRWWRPFRPTGRP